MITLARMKDETKWENRVCKQCGKEFGVRKIYIERGGGKFCSKSCSTTYRNINSNPAKCPEVRMKISLNHADVSGENNPMYGMKGKLSPAYIDGRSKFTGEVYRKIALANLEHKCSLCNEDDISKLDVHHKDGNNKNNKLNNLVFLCKKCHYKVAHNYIRNERGFFIGSKLNREVVL